MHTSRCRDRGQGLHDATFLIWFLTKTKGEGAGQRMIRQPESLPGQKTKGYPLE
ncbi:hypothetical protein HRM2_15990 [Desulforapulum autotrophicum HRM2]|uniref:Uncharacterized protein n=1 Tax=Desulforapulum autotrophicum (strain ATCC 43914 / DSM 3382 / VKM B-1955 / HRM2) TaxID=177437 RepID=C0QAC3_DESAH|nr:hypothetical protein HRM2_15990 [Desulforapulum autotrophicum HRM2]